MSLWDIPVLPKSWTELIGFAIFFGFQAYAIRQNRQQLANQAGISKQLDGATEIAVKTAGALGLARGNIEGAHSEQEREKERVMAADAVIDKRESGK